MYLHAPGINNGLEFVDTTTYSFYPVEGVAPARSGTLPTPSGCAPSSIGGYFFDPYEHAEYVNGLLRWHFRFTGSFPDGRPWTSHVSLYDASCRLIGNSFQFYGQSTNLTPFMRYWSVRFSSLTHYDIWSDETNAKMICAGCSGDIPDPVQTPYTYVSFFGFVDGNASTLLSTPFAVSGTGTGIGAAPSVSSISPTSGTQGQTLPNFTVNGSNFDPAAVLSFSGSGITVNGYVSRTSAQIVANITLASNATVGAINVIVTNPDSQQGTLAAALTISAALPPIPGPPPPPLGTGPANSSVSPQASVNEPISTAMEITTISTRTL